MPLPPGPGGNGPQCQFGERFCHDLAGGGSAIPCLTDGDCGGGEFCWDDCWGDYRGASCVPEYPPYTDEARCYIPKNRYLTLDTTPCYDMTSALQVRLHTAANLDGQYDECGVLEGWLSEPVCRDATTGCPVDPQPPPTDPCQGGNHFGWVSYIVPGPVSPWVWQENPLFVAGREIVPAATYEIRPYGLGCLMDSPLVIPTSHHPNGDAQHWGDVTSSPGVTIPWMAPEFATSFADVSAVIATFQHTGGPAPEWSDLEIDHVVSFGDISFVVQAFEGKTYPAIADIMGGCPSEDPRPLIGHEPCDCP